MYDFQKANMFKRISAALLDLILIAIIATGMAFLLSAAFDYESYSTRLEELQTEYEQTHGVSFEISEEEYQALSREELHELNRMWREFASSEEYMYNYQMSFQLTILIATFGILLAFLILEFFVPLLFKNGQTVGKKIFALGVMREDGVKLSPMLLFIRTLLGKYTAETMLPILLIIWSVFAQTGLFGIGVAILLLVVQTVMLIVTTARTPIHDKLAHTVVVDLMSQRIFETEADLINYKKELAAERANESAYF